MTPKNNRLIGSLTMKLVILGLAIFGLGLVGCSDDLPTNAPAGGNDPATGVFRVAMDDDVDFEIISTKSGDPENPIEGPFAILGRNIRYDSETGALIVDLSVKNLGENNFDEVITLTFLSLLPEGVTILNPDNNENGPGAAIDFEFENDDGQWTPGEESLPRETHFDVDEGVSIGFIARLDTGTGGDAMGSIGGLVWNDANGDGIIDEDESFVEGAMLELTSEGMEAMTTTTGADGTYSFTDLPSGFYTVTKMPSEGMVPTTSTMIYVVLVHEDGDVISFMAANFGCMEGSGGTGVISGAVFNDLNGDGNYDEGEPGLEGVEINLSGDATATTTTAADGTYAFNELMAGSYEIVSVGPDGWVLTTVSPISVMLGADDAVFDLGIFGWMEEASGGTGVISGAVFNDLNGDGNYDEGEPGLEGVEINLSGDATATTTTAADGTYAFNELMAGSYEIVSVGPDGWVLTTVSPISVMLGADDAVFDLGIFGWMEEASGGTGVISGAVFNDLNGDGNYDEGEPGLEGVEINLSGDATATTTTAADGTYAFNELTAGSYEIVSVGPDGWVLTTASPISVMLGADDTVFDLGIFGWMEEVAGDTGVISGVVFNDLDGNGVQDDGEPGLEGISVTLDGTSITMTTSAADGSYSFPELGVGDYKVRSSGSEGWSPTTGPELTIRIETVGQVVDDAHLGWKEDVPQ